MAITAARPPVRSIRPRTEAELRFLSLGPLAEDSLGQAAAAGSTRLAGDLVEIDNLERAIAHRRFRAGDIRAILAAGASVPHRTSPGADPPSGCRPSRSARHLYRGARVLTATAPPVLAPDLAGGLKRLKLRTVRELAPRCCRVAGFPVRKTLDEFAVADSSIPRATFDYLALLEWLLPLFEIGSFSSAREQWIRGRCRGSEVRARPRSGRPLKEPAIGAYCGSSGQDPARIDQPHRPPQATNSFE
jgi:hypothetical protein